MYLRSSMRFFTYGVPVVAPILSSCSQQVSDEQIRNYIASHPEEIVETVLKYREKAVAQRQASWRAGLKKAVAGLSENSGVVINPTGQTSVIEILDYNCGYCKAAFKDLEKRAAGEWRDVKFTLVALPIISEQSRLAVLATRSAVATDQQPTAFMQALLSEPSVSDDVTRRLAAKYALRMENINRLSGQLSSDMRLVEQLHIRATPTFIVGDKILTGYRPDELAAAIAQMKIK